MSKSGAWLDPEHPPWGENFNAGNGVWFCWVDGRIHLWHWCDRSVIKRTDDPDERLPTWFEPQWVLVGVGAHTQLAGPPVTLVPTETTLDPSVLWPHCCGKHGWLRNGQWQSA